MTGFTTEQITELHAAMGRYNASDINPTGIVFSYNDGQQNPYEISDDYASESFSTYKELLTAAKSWRRDMDENSDFLSTNVGF